MSRFLGTAINNNQDDNALALSSLLAYANAGADFNSASVTALLALIQASLQLDIQLVGSSDLLLDGAASNNVLYLMNSTDPQTITFNTSGNTFPEGNKFFFVEVGTGQLSVINNTNPVLFFPNDCFTYSLERSELVTCTVIGDDQIQIDRVKLTSILNFVRDELITVLSQLSSYSDISSADFVPLFDVDASNQLKFATVNNLLQFFITRTANYVNSTTIVLTTAQTVVPLVCIAGGATSITINQGEIPLEREFPIINKTTTSSNVTLTAGADVFISGGDTIYPGETVLIRRMNIDPGGGEDYIQVIRFQPGSTTHTNLISPYSGVTVTIAGDVTLGTGATFSADEYLTVSAFSGTDLHLYNDGGNGTTVQANRIRGNFFDLPDDTPEDTLAFQNVGTIAGKTGFDISITPDTGQNTVITRPVNASNERLPGQSDYTAYTATIVDASANAFTLSNATSKYRKISGEIHFDFRADWTSKGSASGALRFLLPPGFPVVDLSSLRVSLTIGDKEGITYADSLSAYTFNALTWFYLRTSTSGGSSAFITAADCANSGYVYVSGIYNTTTT